MTEPITDIVILGGGSAGWMTAAYLGKALQGSVRVSLIEADTIPKIGVGEATVPNLHKVFFHALGLSEDEWMRACNASIKSAVKLIGWRRPADSGEPDHFYHPFGLLPTCDGLPLSQYWARRRLEGDRTPYDYACLREPPFLDAKLSPRRLDGHRATRYAWHFDAHLVACYLRDLCKTRWGITHVVAELDHVLIDDRGFITALRMNDGRLVTGDLFIDCSGFKALLINKAMQEPFIAMGDHLLCDSAVAAQVPHDDERHGIEPYTSAIAMKSGWTWKIPMLGRFGSGYVFSSRFATMDEAARDFCALWKLDPEKTALNKIRFRVGRNRRAWVRNCVSIGLSSCFLEPLESTGLYFIYASIYQLMKHFPDKRFDPVLRDRFNREIELMFDDCRDFIQAHFVVSPREDTPFWRTNKHELTLSDNIRDKMDTYRAGLPINLVSISEHDYYDSFDFEFRNFWTTHSYYCIFGGLGFVPARPLPILAHRPESCVKAEAMFAAVRQQQEELVVTLPTMYAFLRSLHCREKDPQLDTDIAYPSSAV